MDEIPLLSSPAPTLVLRKSVVGIRRSNTVSDALRNAASALWDGEY